MIISGNNIQSFEIFILINKPNLDDFQGYFVEMNNIAKFQNKPSSIHFEQTIM